MLNQLQVWGRARLLVAAIIPALCASPAAADVCRSASVDLASRDMSIELGVYGVLFREASRPECRATVRDQLLRKLRDALTDPPALDPVLGRTVKRFERWLAGANVGLAIPTAMQLGGANLLDVQLDQAVRATIGAYRFNPDPTCGPNFYNECIDDLTQSAVAYAWGAAYEAKSGRNAATRAAAARDVIHQSLALDNHLCIRSGDSALPRLCSTLTDVANGLHTGFYEVTSFNHGFQDVAYGIGLMTSVSSAAIALEEAGFPLDATEEEITVAWALFHEAQRRTAPDGSAFRRTCIQVLGSAMRNDSPCADAEYAPRMFPVRTLYQRVFRNAPNEDPFRFEDFDPTLFNTAFINDGRYAVYGELGERWWHVRPRLEGYRGAPLRVRTVR
jgi:hypothetical protein